MHRFSGQHLRRVREARGMPPEGLAYAIGRTLRTVYFYESGAVDPPASVVARMAAVLGCDPGDFFTQEPVDAPA